RAFHVTGVQTCALPIFIRDNEGVVILSAPKDQGLTTLFYAVLRSHDAFLQHIQTIERDPDQDLEGITQNKLGSNPQPGEEAKQEIGRASGRGRGAVRGR